MNLRYLWRQIAWIGYARHNPPSPLDRANHRHFLGAAPALVRLVIVPFVSFARLAANVSLVRFDDAVQQFLLIWIGGHRGTDPMHHAPHGRAAHAQVTGDLIGAGRFLGVEHQREDQEPSAKRDMRAVKEGANRYREGAGAIAALPTRPASIAAGMAANVLALAIWTHWPTMPANTLKIFDCLFLGLEGLEDFNNVHKLKMPLSTDKSIIALDGYFVKSKSVHFRNILHRRNAVFCSAIAECASGSGERCSEI